MKVILFDGVCNLCNSTVSFIIERDKENKFVFAPLQSDYAKRLKSEFVNDLSTIILVDNETEYVRSTAVLRILKELNGYRWLKIFLIIPIPIRDFFYRLISSKRYMLFGKRKSCMLPSKDLLKKFIN